MPKIKPRLLALDSETTGVDLAHGASPFLVTLCDPTGENLFYEWDVDPLTRKVCYSPEDVDEIQRLISRTMCTPSGTRLVLQHGKFDARALATIPNWQLDWPWELVEDTLIAGHLLASNHPHSLDAMSIEYLGVNIQPYEKALERACKEARDIAKRSYPEWRIAKEGLPEMPSAKGGNPKSKSGKTKMDRGAEDNKPWKFDAWLPRAIAKVEGYPEDHPWWVVTSRYANVDSATTLALWQVMEKLLRERGLWKLYRERMRVVPIVYGMEARGITVNFDRFNQLEENYRQEAQAAERKCVALSGGVLTKLPKSGTSKALKQVLFDQFNLPVIGRSPKTKEPSVDKHAIETWMITLDAGTKGYSFIRNLQGYRKRMTVISYIESYRKYGVKWVPAWDGAVDETTGAGWYVLHSSLSPTGTDTLRWSSSNPNSQNAGKGGVDEFDEYSIRFGFGPAPGREWWSLDGKNVELRIPAYEAGEEELIDLFEHPNDPPYYGSEHLLNFSTVYPDIWEQELKAVGLDKVGPHCKKKYTATYYQWCKNGDFAVGYGAIDRPEGTADKAFHRVGSHARLKSRFAKKEQLNQYYIDIANSCGYVETLPDRAVDPERGYPVLCSRSLWGDVKPTIPLNYHVQSTACWEMMRGMIVTQEYLDELNQRDDRGWFLTMQIHDEIVLDFPYVENKGNLPIVMEIKQRLDRLGYDLIPPVPIPYGIEYHPSTWNKGEVCA